MEVLKTEWNEECGEMENEEMESVTVCGVCLGGDEMKSLLRCVCYRFLGECQTSATRVCSKKFTFC